MFNLLKTDFYQLTMVTAYILSDRANDETGFECYIRRVKPVTNPKENFYYFEQEDYLRSYIEVIKESAPMKDHVFGLFWELKRHKVNENYY